MGENRASRGVPLPAAVEVLDDVVPLLPESIRAGPHWLSILSLLRFMETGAGPAVPRLLELFDRTDETSRIDIAWTLLAIGCDSQVVTDRVIPMMSSPDPEIVFQTGRICSVASSAEARRLVAKLIPRLTPERTDAQQAALNSMWGLAPEAADIGRWHDVDTIISSGIEDLRFESRSVNDFVREAIARIKGSGEPPETPGP